MRTFVDVDGLTQSADGDWYADTLGLEGERIRGEDQRIELLSRLREGAGVTVITGPVGAEFWSLVSQEVTVRVEPDEYDYKERTSDGVEWSYRASGLAGLEIKRIRNRSTPLPGGHDLFPAVCRARSLDERVDALRHVEPIVESDLKVEVVDERDWSVTIRNQTLLAFDWEWDEVTLAPIGLSISGPERNLYLPAGSAGEKLRELVSQRLRAGIPTIFHNAKADLQTQYVGDLLELVGKPIEDTIILAYLAGEPLLGLKELTPKLLGRPAMDYPGDLANKSIELQARYACADTRNTYDLYQHFTSTLDAETLAAYQSIERPLAPIIGDMERHGSPVALPQLRGLTEEYRRLEDALRSYCWQRWRYDVADDKQTRALLTELLGYDPGTLDQRVLSRIQEEWMDVIIGYRKVRTLRRNYLAGLSKRLQSVHEPTLYPRFNQAGGSSAVQGRNFKSAPRTGRLSSADPNVQQMAPEIREIFVAPEGCLYWYFDYSQLELRVAASLSQDPVMLRELTREGGDLHELMRQNINDELGVDVSRYTAKRSNFLLRYGGSADMLVTVLALERIFLPHEVAEAIVDIDKRTYTRYWEWFNENVGEASVSGFGRTMAGRSVSYPDLRSSDPYLRSHAERAVGNLAVQGSASDVVKRAMVDAAPLLRHYKAHLAIQVHDSLSGWVPERKAEEFMLGMKTIMESQQLPGIDLKVEGGVGRNWSEASS